MNGTKIFEGKLWIEQRDKIAVNWNLGAPRGSRLPIFMNSFFSRARSKAEPSYEIVRALIVDVQRRILKWLTTS